MNIHRLLYMTSLIKSFKCATRQLDLHVRSPMSHGENANVGMRAKAGGARETGLTVSWQGRRVTGPRIRGDIA